MNASKMVLLLALMVGFGVVGSVGCAPTADLSLYDWSKLSAPASFLLGPDDVLEVEFWNQKELSREVTVRPDGSINLPLIGSVEVQGLSPDEAQQVITQRMTQFEKNPVVTVSLKSIKSYRVYVTGKVQRPGMFQATRKVTVMQALSLAGGLAQFADGDRIVIIRRVGNTEQQLPFVYSKVVEGAVPENNIVLASGDTVVVP